MMATLKFLGGTPLSPHPRRSKRRIPRYMEPIPPSEQPPHPTDHHHHDHDIASMNAIIDNLLGLNSSNGMGMEQEEEEESVLSMSMVTDLHSPGFTTSTNFGASSKSSSSSSSATAYSSSMSGDSEILSPRNRLLRKQMDRNRTKALMSHMDQQAVISKMFRGDHLNNNNNNS